MSFTVIIPARYASTRLPGKALADIVGKPMVAHVVDRARESKASRVIVATDHQEIIDALDGVNCEVCLTSENHQSGSDRLAEVVQTLNIADDEIIVNVQGDEPMIPGRLIDQVASSLINTKDAAMSTAARKITNLDLIDDPNIVKVVFTHSGRAMYFSRACIPFARDERKADAWHHIGIYAYRSAFLKRYHSLSPSLIEQTESLEQLRVLDNGEHIMVEQVDYETGIGVDTPADLEKIRLLMSKE